MKIKQGFELRDVCGEQVVMAHGRENIDFSKIISLNETAAYLWNKAIDREFTAQDMVDALIETYEVDRATAVADVDKLLAQWVKNGLVD
ncbi:MAG: PqqD family protein [Clostridium sp.]|nr:PqqD family protein [Clostridium sp.]